MIVISGVSDIDTEQYDSVWYITNNCPNMKIGCEHHSELAPFIGDYMKYRRGDMSLSELLNEYGQALWAGKYKSIIDELIEMSEQGKWIQLVCYCKDYTKCHRFILYKYLSTYYNQVILLDEPLL